MGKNNDMENSCRKIFFYVAGTHIIRKVKLLKGPLEKILLEKVNSTLEQHTCIMLTTWKKATLISLNDVASYYGRRNVLISFS